jgi:dUTP pyrophosphatase
LTTPDPMDNEGGDSAAMLDICCYKLRPDAISPQKSKDIFDAGHDLFTPDPVSLVPGERKTVGTGLVIWYEPTRGVVPWLSWYPRLAPKSGLAAKNGLAVLGGVGDRGYCGPEDEMKVILLNTGNWEIVFAAGAAICQIIPEAIWTCRNMTAIVRPEPGKSWSRGGLGSGVALPP